MRTMRSNLATELSQFIDITGIANDNGLGFHYIDLETDQAANDNGEYEELDESFAHDPRLYEYVDLVPGRLEQLLDQAGYDSTAFWSRGGLAHMLTPPERDFPIGQRGAMGDRNGAMALAFGVAAHLEPEILLVDEVLSVGDLAFQHKARQRMQEMIR